MTRDEALDILKKHIKNENLIKHMLASEAVMRALAVKFGEDEEKWGLAGLLHDIDWEETQDNPEMHTVKSREYLTEYGLDPDIVQAIYVHNHLHNIEPKTVLEKALYCSEELTGLIVACALVRPDKKLSNLTRESVIKKFHQPSFARGVDRDVILKSKQYLDIDLEELVDIEIEAMRKIASSLGL